MKKVIEVTQRHINKGKKGERKACPVYYAINEATGKDIGVGDESFDFIYDYDKYRYTYFKFPRSVKRFVAKFDELGRKAVKPFRFILQSID